MFQNMWDIITRYIIMKYRKKSEMFPISIFPEPKIQLVMGGARYKEISPETIELQWDRPTTPTGQKTKAPISYNVEMK